MAVDKPPSDLLMSVVGGWLWGMSSPVTRHRPTPVPGSGTSVLDGAREARRAEQEAAARILQAAVEWAALHEPTGGREASYWWEAGRAVPLAGEGAPEVSEWAVAEFAAAIGVSTDAGRALVGQALELAWRLPRLWAQVGAGRVPAWRARRVAEQTMALTPEAAAFVDAHVVAVAGKVGPVQLDRLVTEATRRFMPQTLPVDAYDCPDRRRVEIDTDQVSFDGTVTLRGEVDLLDALHLDQALTHTADQLALAGSPSRWTPAGRVRSASSPATSSPSPSTPPSPTTRPGSHRRPRPARSRCTFTCPRSRSPRVGWAAVRTPAPRSTPTPSAPGVGARTPTWS
ncbi:MAG: DUF222 domain-containing protein [Nocardioides sp.]